MQVLQGFIQNWQTLLLYLKYRSGHNSIQVPLNKKKLSMQLKQKFWFKQFKQGGWHNLQYPKLLESEYVLFGQTSKQLFKYRYLPFVQLIQFTFE